MSSRYEACLVWVDYLANYCSEAALRLQQYNIHILKLRSYMVYVYIEYIYSIYMVYTVWNGSYAMGHYFML